MTSEQIVVEDRYRAYLAVVSQLDENDDDRFSYPVRRLTRNFQKNQTKQEDHTELKSWEERQSQIDDLSFSPKISK